MDIQTLSIRLSECLDDLSLLLDQLYKFPQRQREAFFQKIHSLKNRLLSLKSSLRQTPLSTSEKHYKQLYLAMNALKNELTLQTAALQATKENRERNGGQIREIKEVRRNYEDAMRVVVQRQEEVRVLRGELYEKEEVAKLNFVQLQRLRGEVELLIEENRRLQYQRTAMQLELDSTRAAIDRTSDTALQFRVRQQQKDRAFLSAVEQLQHLKVQLITANEKIAHFQQLAQVSIRKTRQVQENIKKVERQAQGLNENYRLRQGETLRKLRQLGEVQFQLGLMGEQNRQLQLQNRRLKEDIEVLESEIVKLNKAVNDQRGNLGEERQKNAAEQRRLISQIETASIREGELRRVVEQWQKKYLLAVGKLNSSEELKIRTRELQVKIQTMEDRIKRTELALQQSKKEGLQYLREKQRMVEQLEMQTRLTREAELQAFRLKEKGRIKEEERSRMIVELQALQSRLKQGERTMAVFEVSRASLQTQLMQERSRVAKGQEWGRIKEKQIEGLRVKLLQAKIQTVHEIREVINA